MTRKISLSTLTSCLVASVLSSLLVLGCSPKQREEMKTVANKKTDSFIKLEKLTETEDKTAPTRYSLKLNKPFPLKEMLESGIVPEILAIGASVKFQVLSGEKANEWRKKIGSSPATIVGISKEEFTFADEIIFSVYFPAASS